MLAHILTCASGVVQAGVSPMRSDALRALAIMERLALGLGAEASPTAAASLSDALLPLTAAPCGRIVLQGAAEAIPLRALGVLAALWRHIATSAVGGLPQISKLWALA